MKMFNVAWEMEGLTFHILQLFQNEAVSTAKGEKRWQNLYLLSLVFSFLTFSPEIFRDEA